MTDPDWLSLDVLTPSPHLLIAYATRSPESPQAPGTAQRRTITLDLPDFYKTATAQSQCCTT